MPNGRRFSAFRCGTLAIAALMLGTPLASRAADLSRDVRTAPDETANRPLISVYVQSQVTSINQDQDPKRASTARESLIDEVRGLVDPSPQFLDAYCAELKSQFTPLLSGSSTASIRVRLNLAIVVAEVAAKAQDAQLAPLVVAELNDPSEAVVLWALKAAHEVIPPALSVPSLKVQILAAVIKAAQRLGTGPIIAAGYNALAVGDVPPASPVELIAPVQNLLAWRIQQYAAATPPEPPADARATAFLTQRYVWQSQPAAQQKTLQLIIDLIGAATTDLATAQGDDRDELSALLSQTGKALYVIGLNTSDGALQQAATPLSSVNNRTGPAAVLDAASLAIAGVGKAFSGLKMPKGLAIATTAPSTGTRSTP